MTPRTAGSATDFAAIATITIITINMLMCKMVMCKMVVMCTVLGALTGATNYWPDVFSVDATTDIDGNAATTVAAARGGMRAGSARVGCACRAPHGRAQKMGTRAGARACPCSISGTMDVGSAPLTRLPSTMSVGTSTERSFVVYTIPHPTTNHPVGAAARDAF